VKPDLNFWLSGEYVGFCLHLELACYYGSLLSKSSRAVSSGF